MTKAPPRKPSASKNQKPSTAPRVVKGPPQEPPSEQQRVQRLYPEAVDRVGVGRKQRPPLADDAALCAALDLDPAVLRRFLQKARMTGRWGGTVSSAAELVRRILMPEAQGLNEPLLIRNPTTNFAF